jgi:Predicted transcriptional regulators containing the CopG/Arc/MetJ DNA-binding domain and a metal-binding domain
MPKTKAKEKMVLISVHLPKQMLDVLDEMVSQGRFPSRSEAIRVAVRDLILRESGLKQRELELQQILIPGR